MQEEETLQQSFESIELLRGCYRSDPSSMIGQPMYAGGYPHIGSGVEQIMGTPTKLAVNGTLAVALSNRVGPYILESPPLSDMDDDLQQFVQSGAIERIGWARSNVSTLDRNFADIAIHPISGYPMALAGNKIITYPKDNAAQIGSVLNPIQAVRPVALAMDPGPNPEFALIADEGAGKVLVGQLSAVSVRFNPLSDFVQLNACPIDVSIRTRTQARRPFAQNPNEKAEAKTQSSQQ